MFESLVAMAQALSTAKGPRLRLLCWCKRGPCHTHVLAKAIMWAVDQRAQSQATGPPNAHLHDLPRLRLVCVEVETFEIRGTRNKGTRHPHQLRREPAGPPPGQANQVDMLSFRSASPKKKRTTTAEPSRSAHHHLVGSTRQLSLTQQRRPHGRRQPFLGEEPPQSSLRCADGGCPKSQRPP